MIDFNLDYDEEVILQSEDVIWVSRNNLLLNNFVLTNKGLYCSYEKNNGFFRKPTTELCVFSLSDIKIINSQVSAQQVKYEGSWCLQIQFRQGTEYFTFSNTPKKLIPQWIVAINNALGIAITTVTSTSTKRNNPFFGAIAEAADSFRSAINAVTGTSGTLDKQFSEIPHVATVSNVPNQQTVPQRSQSAEAQTPRCSFCVNCGTELSPSTKFCPNCGHKVADLVSADASVPESPKPFSTQRQQEYVGKIFKCPNCGNVINQSDAVCNYCGFHLSGKEANSSATDFQQQLLKVEMTRQDKKMWNKHEVLDATDKQIIALIKSYPIPNTIDDIVEFMHLAIGNIDVKRSKKSFFNSDDWDGKSREREISNAWVGKLQQIYKKAELYFPNEPEFAHIKEAYESMMKQLNML